MRSKSNLPTFWKVLVYDNDLLGGAGAGKAAVAALNRPLEIDICLDDDKAAVAYIIDKPTATH